MEIRRLNYFLKIAEEGSLNAASRALGIAQPALSRQMQLLEVDLGVSLFKRVARGMQLTEEGDYLRSGLQHPLEQISTVLNNVRSFSTRVEAHATIGFPPALADLIGPRLMIRLAEAMPNLKLSLVEDESDVLVSELIRGTLDIALVQGLVTDERLFHAEIVREDLVLVGSSSSALAGHDEVPFSDLEKYPLVAPPMTSHLTLMLKKLAARQDCKTNIIYEVESLSVTKSLVLSGAAYAILSPISVQRECAAGDLVMARITDPAISLITHSVVQAHWRIARSTYKQFHDIYYDILREAVDHGDWPGTWLLPIEAIQKPMV